MKISAVVLTYNCEDTIERALQSLDFADEIIVVDSGSKDRTVQIAEHLGCRVFLNPWPGYAEQKQFGVDKTNYDWIFVLDSDEEVSKELRKWLTSLKTSNQIKADGYAFKRVMFIEKERIDVIWRNEFRIRLFRKKSGTFVGKDPHEKILVSGVVKKVPLEIYHFSYQGLVDQVRKLTNHAKTWAETNERISCLSSIVRLFVSPISRFTKMFLIRFGFALGIRGFILCVNEAYYAFLKYAILIWNKRLKNDRSA
ncbi:MAG: glycosyltransferase family 2 protein [Deltaproteobacteria bacterium]|nr:glycosyltransferase family 2 protein [Deltaproteobacteria bacterium]